MAGKPEIVTLDVETSGLDEKSRVILELGIVVTDLALEEIATFSMLVVDDLSISHLDWLAQVASIDTAGLDEARRKEVDDARYVHEMHQKSGLDRDLRNMYATGVRATMADVEAAAIAFLQSHGIGEPGRKLPMTGSSIQFDRRFIEHWMPLLDEQFHYRNIDISSIRGLADLYRADIAERRKHELKPDGLHRSLSDCRDSLRELEFYLMNTMAQVPQ